jgi:hypothetical protein
VVDLLGGAEVLGVYLQSDLDLVRATRERLLAETPVRLAELVSGSAAGIDMVAARATDPPGRLTPEQSDIVVRTATALARASMMVGYERRGRSSK